MVLTYAPAVEDLLEHLEYQAKTSPVLRRNRRVARVLLVVVFGLIALVLVGRPGDHGGPLLAVGVGLAFVAVVTVPLATVLRRIMWRSLLSGPRGAAHRSQRTLTVEPEGLRVRSPQSETLTRWEGIYDVVELPQVVLVQVGPMSAHVIPRGAFASDADRAAFVAELRSHLP